jgi:uncharacterized membrane protein YhaH (DUF805 family)
MMNLLFSIKGRIPRGMYWLGYVPTFLLAAPLIILVEKAGGDNPIIVLAVMMLYVWIVIALAAKRLHDMDTSAGWVIFALIPLVAWVFGAIRGTAGPNTFGLDPLEKNAPH